MGRQFLTLIHGGTIHIAPRQKIIRKKDFSTALDAQKLLEEVKKDAESYRLEVAKDCESEKEQGFREGYEAGFASWAEQIAALEKEISQVRDEATKMVIPVALKAAKKIIGHELETNRDIVVDIVSNSLKGVAQHKKIAIFVNKKDFEVLEANKGRLKQLFENLEALSIRERSDVLPGGSIIETEGGIINAQLDNQWSILEKAFAKLMKLQEKENAS